MAERLPILPSLKPHDWPARAYALSRPLVAIQGVPHVPWVGYGYNHAYSFEFLSRESFPNGGPEEHIRMIEQAALRNLRQRPVTWKLESVRLGIFRRLPLLICSDDFLAAEHILDPRAMLQAAEMLKTRRLAVGVPSRGVLVATRAPLPKKLMRQFSAMVAAQFYTPRAAAISPTVFVVEDGQIIGAITGQEQAGQRMAQEEERRAAEVYINAVISADRATGKETLHLLTGSSDLERLTAAVLQAFVQGAEQMSQRADFSGLVRVVLIPEMMPTSADLQENIERLQQHLRGVVEDLGLRAPSGGPIQVNVVYGRPEETGHAATR